MSEQWGDKKYPPADNYKRPPRFITVVTYMARQMNHANASIEYRQSDLHTMVTGLAVASDSDRLDKDTRDRCFELSIRIQSAINKAKEQSDND